MSIITRMRKQDAVYWAYSGLDEFGQVEVGDPAEIKVRWEDIDLINKTMKRQNPIVTSIEFIGHNKTKPYIIEREILHPIDAPLVIKIYLPKSAASNNVAS